MNIRKPIVAGQFYPDSKASTLAALDEYLSVNIAINELPEKILGGIVPHAGWVCSGAVAGKVFKAIQMRRQVDTFVLFGAVHRFGVRNAAVYSTGAWETPLGQVAIDERLASQILIESNLLKTETNAHQAEHSIEVQVPFIQRLFPQARILPILVPPTPCAGEVGAAVASIIKKSGANAVCIGSSDLTHYGPSYRFTPEGIGSAGIRWAKEINDRGLLDLIGKMNPQAVLEYAVTTQSACGSGAIAATIAAAKELGADTVKLLEHTTSHEVLRGRYGDQGTDSVGYAGIVFGIETLGQHR
ncbi:MAG: AmmeMemoRadiSam system protein B [Phycisphaerae bacterium]